MYWLTQSLLSSWKHFLDADDAYADAALSSFLSTLRREERETTPAMQAGIDFEAAINSTVAGVPIEPVSEKYDRAVAKFSRICAGGQPQVPVAGRLRVAGLDFQLYGVCDYVKAGIIYDIKRVQRYEYGKYLHSPQHPMYLHLLPGASKFTYLIFDGTSTYAETYRRGDFEPIEDTISHFINWLLANGYINDYFTHWEMNTERMDKIDGIQSC